jgi:hypothetical protein
MLMIHEFLFFRIGWSLPGQLAPPYASRWISTIPVSW